MYGFIYSFEPLHEKNNNLETSNKNWFWSIKILATCSVLKCTAFRATCLSTYILSFTFTYGPSEPSEPECYGDLVYKLKLVGRNGFSCQFRKKSLYVTDVTDVKDITDSLHAYILTQSWLITMLPFLIVRRWVGRQIL